MTMEPLQTASAIDNAVVRGSAATPTMAGGDNLRAPAAPLPGLPPDRAALIQERRGQAAAVGLENANQGSTGARIPALTRALSNPNLPDAQRQLGLVYLKEAIDSTKAPDGVKEFLWARGQGLTQAKSPNEYAREKQKPDDAWEALTTPEQRAAAGIAAGDTHPVQRSLSTGKLEFVQPAPATAESEFERKVGGQRAEDYGEIVKRMRSAGGQLDTLKRMEAQMTDPKFYSGPFSGTAKAALRAAATVGLVMPDLADRNAAQPMEVFESLSNKLVTDAAPNGSLGAQISNTDREFMARIVPNLDASPAANAYLIQMRREILTREQEMAKQARAYVQKNRGFDEGFYEEWERWKEANPIERKLSPPPDALKAAPSAATAPAGLQPNERIIEWTPQTMGRF
jgi:hypothetical protein